MRVASFPIVIGDIQYNVKDGDYKKEDIIVKGTSKNLQVQATGKMLFDIGCRLIWVFSFKDVLKQDKLLLQAKILHEHLHRKELPLKIDALTNDILSSFSASRDVFHQSIINQFGLGARLSDLSKEDAQNFAKKLFDVLEPLRGQ